MKPISAIQLAKLTDKKPSDGIDKILRYEYMGNSYFEFGAKGNSLRRIIANELVIVEVKGLCKAALNRKNKPISQKVYIIGSPDIIDEYIPHIQYFANPEKADRKWNMFAARLPGKEIYTMQEPIYFYVNLNSLQNIGNTYDVWWDLDNDVMWTFGKENASKLTKAINASAETIKRREEEKNDSSSKE